MLKNILSKISNFTLLGLVVLSLFGSINSFAQSSSQKPLTQAGLDSAGATITTTSNSTASNCNVSKSQVRWYSIATPATFIPIIPETCAQKDGKIQPLSLKIIPEIVVRLFGFIISLVWLLLLPTVIFAGIWYIWGGIDGTSSGSAQRLLQNSLLSLLSLFFFFIIVFTFLSLFGAGTLASTELSTLFN